MKTSEIVSLVDSTWNNALPDKRIEALNGIRGLVPNEHLELFDALIDSKVSNIHDDDKAIVLILIHGIQTDGAWHKHVVSEFSDVDGINVHSLGYECVSAAQLVSPFRRAPVRKIEIEIRDIRRREPKARIMCIAHSFGSYVVSKILKNHPDIEFERIILCGSIIPRDFRWDLYANRMTRNSIVNDVGTVDYYPLLATCASVGYGSSGYRGFQNSIVCDRYFPYGHSTFFERRRNHIRRFWKPFITNGSLRTSRWDTLKPKTNLLLLLLSHPWIGRTVIFSLLFFVLYVIYILFIK